MSGISAHKRDAADAAWRQEFTPQLVSVLREGYGWPEFKADALAGLTVAIVALPLSMAIALACGVSPDRGLYTAIVGGFIVSTLGGSRHQVGGPAGAFIVLIATIIEQHGFDGLVLATMMAGVMMIAIGGLRLGSYIKYIPLPVLVGFTTGIAVIIFSGQIKDLLGLDIVKEPAALWPKLKAIWAALPTVKPVTCALAAAAIATILVVRHYRPQWPGLLIAVAGAAAATALFHLDVATIGSRFGAMPSSLPWPSVPAFSLAKLQSVLPAAISIALLGSIESLLSAVVADGMSGRRHRSNIELVAQGGANIAAVMFGGICVTGTIARTATNVRSGAVGPVSGMLHAVYVLAFILVAAPMAAYIPLASLGAVLAVVSWNMAEKHEFGALLRMAGSDAVVVTGTFLLTIFVDLTIAIGAGVALSALVFLHRSAEATEVDGGAMPANGLLTPADGSDIMVYRVNGAFFFGSTAQVGVTLDRIGVHPRAFVLDLAGVPLIDISAARMLETFAEKLVRSGTLVYIAGASRGVRRSLLQAGLRRPLVRYAASHAMATASARARLDGHAEPDAGANGAGDGTGRVGLA